MERSGFTGMLEYFPSRRDRSLVTCGPSTEELDRQRQSFHSSGKDFLKLFHHFPVHQAVAGQNFAAVNRERPVFVVGDLASGFLDQQNPGGGVPGVEVKLPESVEAPTGDVAEVERRRTSPAHTVRAQRDLVIEMDVGILMAFVARKASSHQTLRHS